MAPRLRAPPGHGGAARFSRTLSPLFTASCGLLSTGSRKKFDTSFPFYFRIRRGGAPSGAAALSFKGDGVSTPIKRKRRKPDSEGSTEYPCKPKPGMTLRKPGLFQWTSAKKKRKITLVLLPLPGRLPPQGRPSLQRVRVGTALAWEESWEQWSLFGEWS